MMMHRKNVHGTKICTGCDRTDSDCWYMHANSVEASPKNKQQKDTSKNTTTSEKSTRQGFWKVPQNVAPTISPLDIEAIMKTMEDRVRQTMELFMKQMKGTNQ